MDDLGSDVLPSLPGALAGDRGSQAKVWECLEPLVEKTIRAAWHGGQQADLADLTQDLAIKLLLSETPALARWDFERPLEPWVATIVRNALRDRVRADRARRKLSVRLATGLPASSVPSPLDQLIHEESTNIVKREVRLLRDTHRKILHGLGHGLTHTQAAAHVGRGPKTAQRAVTRLRARLAATDDNPRPGRSTAPGSPKTGKK